MGPYASSPDRGLRLAAGAAAASGRDTPLPPSAPAPLAERDADAPASGPGAGSYVGRGADASAGPRGAGEGRRGGGVRGGLPRLLVLTDRWLAAEVGRTVGATVEAAVWGGVRGVVLREKDLAVGERLELAWELRALLDPVDGTLIVASDVGLARDVGGVGVHLARDEPPPGDPGLVVGRSCHDGAELWDAAGLGLDYVTLSPVFPTASKPGYGPALGPRMAGLVRDTPRCPPVYALGGVTPERAVECRAAGAYGIAVMGAVMRAADPAAVAAEFVRCLG